MRDVLKAAALALVTCYRCGFQCEMSEAAGVLMHCPMANCQAITCRNCGEEGHVPLRCDENEKKDEVKKRLSVEEAMSKVRIRECLKCKTKFYKLEGCNKMTCSCGAKVCYICRKDITKQNYSHFCQIPHCNHTQCRKCPLFSDALEDDRRAMREAGLQAMAAVDGNGVNLSKEERCSASFNTFQNRSNCYIVYPHFLFNFYLLVTVKELILRSFLRRRLR